MDYKYFKVEIKDKVAHVSIDRPDKANALHLAGWQEMKAVFDTLSKEKTVRAVVLSGSGKHFCAGMDIQTLMTIPSKFDSTCEARRRDELRDFIKLLQACITSIEQCAKPVICAIDGACIGGGLNIIVASDMRFCTQQAYFSIKEVELGIVADMGVLQRIPLLVNQGILADWAYTGRTFDGNESVQAGLCTTLYASQDEMMSSVHTLAKQIAGNSPLTVKGIKKMLLYKRDHSVQDALDYMTVWNSAMLFSNDLMEAFDARMNKRQANFNDL